MRLPRRAVLLHDFDNTFFSRDRYSITTISGSELRAAVVAKLACFIYGEIRTNPWQPLDVALFRPGNGLHELITLGPRSPLVVVWETPNDPRKPFASWLASALRREPPNTFVFSSAATGTQLATEWGTRILPGLRGRPDEDFIAEAANYHADYAAVVEQARICDDAQVPHAGVLANYRRIDEILAELAPLCFSETRPPDAGWYGTRSAAQQALRSAGKIDLELAEAMVPYDLAGIISDAGKLGATPLLRVSVVDRPDAEVFAARTLGDIDAIEFNFDELARRFADFVTDLQKTSFDGLLHARLDPPIRDRLEQGWRAVADATVERHRAAGEHFDAAIELLRRRIRPAITVEKQEGEISFGEIFKIPVQLLLKVGVGLYEVGRNLHQNIHGIVTVRQMPGRS